MLWLVVRGLEEWSESFKLYTAPRQQQSLLSSTLRLGNNKIGDSGRGGQANDGFKRADSV